MIYEKELLQTETKPIIVDAIDNISPMTGREHGVEVMSREQPNTRILKEKGRHKRW